MKADKLSKQDGFILVVSLLMLAVLIVIATVAVMMTTTDIKLTSSFNAKKKAFYAAEAGVEEARARMRLGAANPINDNHPGETAWSAYIGLSTRAQNMGYNNLNAMHILVPSEQPDMDYVVKIVHQTDGSGNILYWGDANQDGVNERTATPGPGLRNIYLVSSEETYANATRNIEAEMARVPPVNTPAALYVNAATAVKGSSTHIIGTDACGGTDLAGIASSKPDGTIASSGSPTIIGAPSITYGSTVINVANMINTYKGMANFSYVVNNASHTASTTPGPGQGWGTPIAGADLQSPSSCNVHNIVYYNTEGTDIQLSGGVSGCGMLLVEGNLKMVGGFSWYGLILTTGSMTLLGGGDKNITGSVLSGSSASNAEDDVIGGNTNIIYCSSAVQDQTNFLPLQLLSWKDKPVP
ncbi:MAG: pilus assembly PilX N-terminal domain-containing protein [Syntrophales bacterium]|jgi:hypothetical protein|nr:pilus assembly PilX N-terminal domain-containing protein [Syntrophales bacterium]